MLEFKLSAAYSDVIEVPPSALVSLAHFDEVHRLWETARCDPGKRRRAQC